MISAEQWPILIILAPLLAAFVINVAGLYNKRLCQPLTVIALAISLYASIKVLIQVLHDGTIHYRLGGWPPPFGIEYVIDHLNALILVLITAVSVLVSIFAKRSIEEELPDRLHFFYTLFALLVTGLLGMTITGDTFNLYVLMEITALTRHIGIMPMLSFIDGLANMDITKEHIAGMVDEIYKASQDKPYQELTWLP